MLRRQRGDTIIEVLLAFTVFSLVSVGSMTVMAQGVNTSQRALEITQVRQYIESQAEALRAAQQAYAGSENPSATEWNKFAIQSSLENSTRFDDQTTCPTASWINNAKTFIVDARTASFIDATVDTEWYQGTDSPTAPAFAQIEQTDTSVRSYGIWIEREYDQSASAATPDAYSFVVRACWNSPGVDVPIQIETVVRLYEPNS